MRGRGRGCSYPAERDDLFDKAPEAPLLEHAIERWADDSRATTVMVAVLPEAIAAELLEQVGDPFFGASLPEFPARQLIGADVRRA